MSRNKEPCCCHYEAKNQYIHISLFAGQVVIQHVAYQNTGTHQYRVTNHTINDSHFKRVAIPIQDPYVKTSPENPARVKNELKLRNR